MASEQDRPYIPAGAVVEDVNGSRIGVVRAVYPHYVAVGEHGDHPQAYRVPVRAIATVDGDRVRLNVPRDVLDPMTAQEQTALGLPEHGGELVVGSPLEEPRIEEEEGMGLSEQHEK